MQGALDLILTSVTKGGLVYEQAEKEIVEEWPFDYSLCKQIVIVKVNTV